MLERLLDIWARSWAMSWPFKAAVASGGVLAISLTVALAAILAAGGGDESSNGRVASEPTLRPTAPPSTPKRTSAPRAQATVPPLRLPTAPPAPRRNPTLSPAEVIDCKGGEFDGWDDGFDLRPHGYTTFPASLTTTTVPSECKTLWLAAYGVGYTRGSNDKCGLVYEYISVSTPEEIAFCSQVLGRPVPSPAPTLPPPPPPEPERAGGLLVTVLPFLFLGNPSYSCSVSSSYISCSTSALNWPDYSCSVSSSYVSCSTYSSDSPDYSCSVSSGYTSCSTYSSGWPDYSCSGSTYVSCTTYSSDWADYSCSVSGGFVSCTTYSSDFPDFSCSESGSYFSCG
jgi:hypothetical protein